MGLITQLFKNKQKLENLFCTLPFLSISVLKNASNSVCSNITLVAPTPGIIGVFIKSAVSIKGMGI